MEYIVLENKAMAKAVSEGSKSRNQEALLNNINSMTNRGDLRKNGKFWIENIPLCAY